MAKKYQKGVLVALRACDPLLRTAHVVDMARKIDKSDHHGEISGLSQLFVNSLPATNAKHSVSLQATQPALFDHANALTWLSYSLFDRIIDHPESVQLPHVATSLATLQVLKTTALQTYLANTPTPSRALDFFHETDTALHTENTLCRAAVQGDTLVWPALPSKKILSSLLHGRSLAHITGPALIAHQLYPKHSTAIVEHLTTYCGLRQLMDDLHDWEADLRSGHITVVVAALLHAVGGTEDTECSLSSLIPELREMFWRTVAQDFCLNSEITATAALESLEHLTGMKPDAPFATATFGPIIRKARDAHTTITHQKSLLATLRRRQG